MTGGEGLGIQAVGTGRALFLRLYVEDAREVVCREDAQQQVVCIQDAQQEVVCTEDAQLGR